MDNVVRPGRTPTPLRPTRCMDASSRSSPEEKSCKRGASVSWRRYGDQYSHAPVRGLFVGCTRGFGLTPRRPTSRALITNVSPVSRVVLIVLSGSLGPGSHLVKQRRPSEGPGRRGLLVLDVGRASQRATRRHGCSPRQVCPRPGRSACRDVVHPDADDHAEGPVGVRRIAHLQVLASTKTSG